MNMTSEMTLRQRLGASPRWVIKIGSALLTDEGRGLDMTAISSWVEQIAALRQGNTELVLVSSGAVAEGMKRLNWQERPTEVYKLQAAAAVGQMGMIQAYESCFKRHDVHTAQVLLTHEDLASRERYLNARSTLRTLLGLGVVPVINENDTVATDEIRLGDNDTLAGLVANLVEADLLIILTDQQGLFARDPRVDPTATLIEFGQAGDPELEAMASGKGGKFGRGGMLTKLKAATRAGRSGAATLIVSGRISDVLMKIAAGENLGTLLYSAHAPLAARKQWLASHLKVRGELHLDAGAVTVLQHGGKSLLPIGVTQATGQFTRGDMVACLAPDGTEIARGFINYPLEETQKILRQPSDKIEQILGYVDEPELIHRDNLVLV